MHRSSSQEFEVICNQLQYPRIAHHLIPNFSVNSGQAHTSSSNKQIRRPYYAPYYVLTTHLTAAIKNIFLRALSSITNPILSGILTILFVLSLIYSLVGTIWFLKNLIPTIQARSRHAIRRYRYLQANRVTRIPHPQPHPNKTP